MFKIKSLKLFYKKEYELEIERPVTNAEEEHESEFLVSEKICIYIKNTDTNNKYL